LILESLKIFYLKKKSKTKKNKDSFSVKHGSFFLL